MVPHDDGARSRQRLDRQRMKGSKVEQLDAWPNDEWQGAAAAVVQPPKLRDSSESIADL